MNWETKRLEEVADFCLGKMLDQKKNRGELMPYLANINVRWGEFEMSELRQMRFEPHEMDRYGLRYGDIVMCEGGEPGRCAIWKEQQSGMMIQKALHRIRPHERLRPEFLFYYFLHKGRLGHFSSLYTGSTIKHLPREKLALIEVPIPPLHEQTRIADILSAYDDLIENNRRRIALLEESARLLYREWFVHLRFPGHEHVKIIDGVPEGWERRPIAELTDYLGRGIAPKYDDNAECIVVNQKCIRGGLVNLELARAQSKTFSSERQLVDGDVLINSTGEGTLGRVAQIFSPPEVCTVDSHVTIARPCKTIGKHYFGISLIQLESVFSTMGRGATNQTELSKQQIGEIQIYQPCGQVILHFEKTVAHLRTMVHTLSRQNVFLSQARDHLLPKLMSGEVEV